MQKTVKKKQLNEIINALDRVDYISKTKTLFIVRCEKLLKKLTELGTKVNEAIQDIREEYAETDKDGRFVYEQVTVADKAGTSRTENTGSFKYTHKRADERDKAINKVLDEDIEIPVYIITREEKHTALYKSIFNSYSLTTITTLAGLILDVPLDAEGFIDEEFVLEMTGNESSKNGQQEKAQSIQEPVA